MDSNHTAGLDAYEMPDPKIGTIVVSVQTGDNQTVVSVVKEVRDVFASKYFADRPYYLTNTANRIYVMDKTRINFFPNGESVLEKISTEIKLKQREEAKERAKRIITEKCDRDELQEELQKKVKEAAEGEKGDGVGHCGAAGMPEEDGEGGANQDRKIGTILMRKLGGGDRAANTPEDEDECLEMERRYVFASAQCQNEPYYLSMTGNRIFVVDKRRIEYFPNGVEPESIQVEMTKWAAQVEMCKKRRAEAAVAVEEAVQMEQEERERQEAEERREAAEREEAEAEAKKRHIKPPMRTGDPSRIGTIKVQIGKESAMFYPEPGEDGLVTLDVFSNLRFEKPHYLTYTGNRILVVDQSRIILDNPPPMKKKKRPVFI